MKTTVEVNGFLDLVLQKAVDLGIARSKTDALRIGVLELNKNYSLVDGAEAELVIRKIEKNKAENRAKGLEPETMK
ncbi:hypothetical protein COU36_03185, partial [Candidatus Micrarchaeota archaeon CG10_big_fil_rev_8_21_14_0_10_59_7]